MSRYCLDTSAYSHYKRGHSTVVDLIDGAEWLAIPSVVVGELGAGFSGGARAARNWLELDEFLDWPIVEELPVDHAVARIYSTLLASLRQRGQPVPTNDLWVAATAARAGVPVLTYDEHFRHIDRAGAIVLRATEPLN